MAQPGYSFVDATFLFFKVVGRRPLAVLWIAVWHIALYAALTGVIIWLMAPIFTLAFSAAAAGREPSEAEILRLVTGALAGYSLAFIGFLLAALLAQGAWMRLLARDEIAAVIPLRFGADELRLLVVNAAFFVAGAMAWIAVTVIFIALNAGLLAALNNGGGEVGLALTGGLVNVLLAAIVALAAIIIMIRFAAAPALSVRLRGISLFESLSATRGVAAWMFVSYVTLIGVYLGGAIIVGIVQQVVVLLAAADFIPTLAALENTQDPKVVLQVLGDALLRPATLIALTLIVLLQFALQILFEGCWHGVGAYVARRHAGDLPDDSVQTPDASVGAAPREG